LLGEHGWWYSRSRSVEKLGTPRKNWIVSSYNSCFCPVQCFFVFMCSNVFSPAVMFSSGTRSLYAYVAWGTPDYYIRYWNEIYMLGFAVVFGLYVVRSALWMTVNKYFVSLLFHNRHFVTLWRTQSLERFQASFVVHLRPSLFWVVE
jgi:hypothetical protein